MAQIVTLYWRDIPAQVVAEDGRGRKRQQAKIELSRRFALAIDEAAMRGGAESTDDYLADWRKKVSRQNVQLICRQRLKNWQNSSKQITHHHA